MGSFRSYYAGVKFLAVFALLALVIGACSPSAAPQTSAGTPVAGGRVIVGSFADAKVLNPILNNDVPSQDVLNRLYESLVQTDTKTGQPMPRLAEKFEASPDGKTFTFTLRDGLVWSDGTPFTGDDFKFTVQATMRSKATTRKSNFQDIVGATDYGSGKATDIAGIVINGKTITVNFAKASCPALVNMGTFRILPKSVFGKYLDANDATKNLDNAPENTSPPPVAMGAFVFKEWKPNDHITLVRNDKFFLGKPLLDEWVYKIVPDGNALAAAEKTGEVDYVTVEPPYLEDLKKQSNLSFFSYLSPGYTFIGWNELHSGNEFFQDKNVRQALTYGLDMQQVIDKIYLGEGKKMVAHTPPISWAYNAAGLNTYNFDAAKAEQLIQASGYTKGADGIYQKGGQKLEFDLWTHPDNPTRVTLQQVAVEQYKKIGVNAIPKQEAFPALVDRLTKSKDAKYGDQGGHDFGAVIIGWSLTDDPDAYSIWHSSQAAGGLDFIGYKNPAVDKALEDGRTLCGTDQRKAAYQNFDKQLNDDQPYNFGFAGNTLLFVNKRVQGLAPGSFGLRGFTDLQKWWIQQ